MTRLSGQLDEISRELDLLIAGDDNRRVIDEVETAIGELEPVCSSCEIVLARRRALGSAEFEMERFGGEEQQLQLRMQQSLSALQKVWEEEAARVRQVGAVSDMCTVADAYARLVDKNSTTTWDVWRQSLERQFLIASPQLESIRNVLDYAEPIVRYKQGAERFALLARTIPQSESVIAELRNLALSLKKIKEGFVFDLPQPVVRFYDTLDRDGYFPLGSLDQSISKWLADNGGLKDLAIVRRRAPR